MTICRTRFRSGLVLRRGRSTKLLLPTPQRARQRAAQACKMERREKPRPAELRGYGVLLKKRRRRALVTTETDDKAMAVPANMGESMGPPKICKSPAATGRPRIL